MNTSVEAHQIITTRSTRFSSRKRLMSARIASSIARLSTDAMHVAGVDVLDVRAVERRRHRPHVAQRVGDLLDVPAALEHAGPLGGHVGVVGERVPRPEHDVVEARRGARSRGSAGLRSSVRLPRRIVSIRASEPIGWARPRLTSSTPAISVEATAPRPTVRTPRRPSAGATVGRAGSCHARRLDVGVTTAYHARRDRPRRS